MTDTHTQEEIDAAELAYLQRTVPDHEQAIQRMREHLPKHQQILDALAPLMQTNDIAAQVYRSHMRQMAATTAEIERHTPLYLAEMARLAELSA